MRIGVISDTHGSIAAVDRCILRAGEVACWFHLGDISSDADNLAKKVGVPVYSVLGNCDFRYGSDCPEDAFPEPQKDYAAERVITVGGVRIFLCHGHDYEVSLAPFTLSYRAEELGCAAALYGHTHVASLMNYGGLLLLNPGSPSRPRNGRAPSFAMMRIMGYDVNAEIITL